MTVMPFPLPTSQTIGSGARTDKITLTQIGDFVEKAKEHSWPTTKISINSMSGAMMTNRMNQERTPLEAHMRQNAPRTEKEALWAALNSTPTNPFHQGAQYPPQYAPQPLTPPTQMTSPSGQTNQSGQFPFASATGSLISSHQRGTPDEDLAAYQRFINGVWADHVPGLHQQQGGVRADLDGDRLRAGDGSAGGASKPRFGWERIRGLLTKEGP